MGNDRRNEDWEDPSALGTYMDGCSVSCKQDKTNDPFHLTPSASNPIIGTNLTQGLLISVQDLCVAVEDY